jgi:hypothetical protein
MTVPTEPPGPGERVTGKAASVPVPVAGAEMVVKGPVNVESAGVC